MLPAATGIQWAAGPGTATCYSTTGKKPLRRTKRRSQHGGASRQALLWRSDDSEFTYFGEAFLKDALPQSASFQDAFVKAEQLVRARELADRKDASDADSDEFSLPQMFNPQPIAEHLKRWWVQTAPRVGTR